MGSHCGRCAATAVSVGVGSVGLGGAGAHTPFALEALARSEFEAARAIYATVMLSDLDTGPGTNDERHRPGYIARAGRPEFGPDCGISAELIVAVPATVASFAGLFYRGISSAGPLFTGLGLYFFSRRERLATAVGICAVAALDDTPTRRLVHIARAP